MLILFVKFLKLMKEIFENNVEINFEVYINFENLDKKKRIFFFVLYCICVGIIISISLVYLIFFFSVADWIRR